MSSEPAMASLPGCDATEFCRACARFATGVAVLSVLDEAGQPHGMTVNSFTSVSLDPLLFLVCVDRGAGIRRLFNEGSAIAVNVLSEDQLALSLRFARPNEDRFGATEWRPGETGAPLIPGCLASIEGVVQKAIPAGDHAILLTEVQATSYREGRPLIYFSSRYERLNQ